MSLWTRLFGRRRNADFDPQDPMYQLVLALKLVAAVVILGGTLALVVYGVTR